MSTANSPTFPPPSRARLCPVCHGAGRLPSMQVAGITNPCPRCDGALYLPEEHGERPMTLAEVSEAEGRPHRDTDRTVADVIAAALLGIAGGVALTVLAQGLFAMFQAAP